MIICQECGRYLCPAACPNYDGRTAGLSYPVGTCYLCEDNVRDGEEYFLFRSKILCTECADELVSPELLDFLDCKNTKEFFELLLG